MKRSEMIERLTKILSNQYPDCHDIRPGMDNDAAVAVLNACEEAGMHMVLCHYDVTKPILIKPGQELIGTSRMIQVGWESE